MPANLILIVGGEKSISWHAHYCIAAALMYSLHTVNYTSL